MQRDSRYDELHAHRPMNALSRRARRGFGPRTRACKMDAAVLGTTFSIPLQTWQLAMVII